MTTAAEMYEISLKRTKQLQEYVSKGDSDIQKYYDNTVIFLTGASGFLGKQLVEKLIRSCNIKKMYVLLRPKKGKTPRERIQELSKDMMFDIIRVNKPNFEDKIIAVEGDIEEIGLGIKEDDRIKIVEEVDIIFHSAAIVKFDAPIEQATISNVRGTQEILKLARSCKKLKSFVHVSTAYSNATKSRIGKDVYERFYESPIPPDEMIQLVEEGDKEQLKKIELKMMEEWPNTYTYTKAIAEDLIRSASDLSICIVRPPTVVCSYTEPCPGWIDKTAATGATGLAQGMVTGVIHVLMSRNDVKIDFVPVDYVNNTIIASAWDTARRHADGDKNIIIYNACSSKNARPWGELSNIMYVDNRPYASRNSLWYTFCFNVHNKWLYWLMTFLYHIVPACVVDAFSVLTGGKPRFLALYKKVLKLIELLQYFTCNDWNFDMTNTNRLFCRLSKRDQVLFNFDMVSIDRRELILLWCIGIRKFLMKEDLEPSRESLNKRTIQKYITYLITCFYVYMFYMLLKYMFYVICLLLNRIN